MTGKQQNSILIRYVFFVFITLSFLSCSSPPTKTPQTTASLPVSSDEEKESLVIIEDSAVKPFQETSQETASITAGDEYKGDEEGFIPQDEGEIQDPSLILEEAWQAYQNSQIAWDSGDLEAALLELDKAYSLLLDLEISSESALIQDKNDLRLLIARRIQEIYASRQTAIFENHKSIPLEENKYVLEEIKRFQTTERKYFEEAYKRSGRYINIILEELRKEGVPEQLAWLPMIESWFKVTAYSRARALGLWQFISSTGYRYGLKRDRWVDERMDFVKASTAASRYLKELHSYFGDWTTALAAYNCGEFRVQKVINAQRINYLDNFWDLYIMLPRETARFVPRFIATLLIINNPEKYGMNLPEPDPPLEFETITCNKPVRLSTLAQKTEIKAEELENLNPELRHKSTPEGLYELRIPPGYGEMALASVQDLSRWIPPEATYILHYVRRGETLSTIAQRYRTTVSSISRLNGLRSIHLIRPGQRLKIPSQGGYSAPQLSSTELVKDGEKLVYVVERGDTLYKIANAFNTSVYRIKQMNNLSTDMLRVGQRLTIQTGIPQGTTLYTVKSGDSPYKIAQKFSMSLAELLRINGLNNRSTIYPGQQLWVKSNN
ncbi:MAG: LysM peptidoglycan-binding domain-containing protein [Acidobacteriota bacterium]